MVSSSIRRFPTVLAACVALIGGASTVSASVISTTPTLPVLNVPYAAATGVGCFPTAGVCVVPGTFTLTSLTWSSFDSTGQDIKATASYVSTLTTLAGAPLGPVNLLGTLEEEILGRTSSTELGTWATKLLALSLSGPVLGHTLTLTLDPAHASTGQSSIEALGGGVGGNDGFRIDSFFDVFVELTLDTTPPLATTRGPLHLSMVPEPSTWLLLLTGFLGLGFGWRQRPQAAWHINKGHARLF
jgi:hypothetical protein